jgi:hypothetical protein
MEKIVYTSPFFFNDSGEGRKFLIPIEGLKTYQKRDAALIEIRSRGGIHMAATTENMKIHRQLMAAKRMITSKAWFSEPIA